MRQLLACNLSSRILYRKISIQLTCKGMFDNWLAKAKTISKVNDKSKHIKELMFDKVIVKDIDKTYTTIGDSLYHFVKWSSYHRKDLLLFVEHVKTVLEDNNINSTVKNK